MTTTKTAKTEKRANQDKHVARPAPNVLAFVRSVGQRFRLRLSEDVTLEMLVAEVRGPRVGLVFTVSEPLTFAGNVDE